MQRSVASDTSCIVPYNLTSPNGIAEPIQLTDLDGWFARELTQIAVAAERDVLATVAKNLSNFVSFPERAVLLWPECDRTKDYHSYPVHIRTLATGRDVHLDRRANGPAVVSFILAGGIRPRRFGSSNSRSIHHLYSGKFPYLGRNITIHAAKTREHFTQSAGLIAAHPVADALVDEFPFFAWFLRAKVYSKFGYDPDAVFSPTVDGYGFAPGSTYEVVRPDA